MWWTRKAPRKGSVAASLKNQRNAENAAANAAVRGAANIFLNAANAKRKENANTRKNLGINNANANANNALHKARIEKLRDTFKLRRDAEETISKSPYRLDRIYAIADKLSDKIKADERLSIASISKLIKNGDLQKAIVQLIQGKTPTIKPHSDLELFFHIYNDFVQEMIDEILNIPGLTPGPQRGGAIEVIVITAIVIVVLVAVLSRLYTDYLCRFTKYKNAKWCINPKKVTANVGVNNPMRTASRDKSRGPYAVRF